MNDRDRLVVAAVLLWLLWPRPAAAASGDPTTTVTIDPPTGYIDPTTGVWTSWPGDPGAGGGPDCFTADGRPDPECSDMFLSN